MAYSVRITPRARRELKKINRKDQVRIAARINQLQADPQPHDVKKLAGSEDLYRVRVGNYRILYRIEEGELVVLVVRIAPRDEVYRRLGAL